MAVISIIIGTLILAGLFAVGCYAIARESGWLTVPKLLAITVLSTIFGTLVAGLIVGAVLLIGYGIEHL